jgi:hypothetical protein
MLGVAGLGLLQLYAALQPPAYYRAAVTAVISVISVMSILDTGR